MTLDELEANIKEGHLVYCSAKGFLDLVKGEVEAPEVKTAVEGMVKAMPKTWGHGATAILTMFTALLDTMPEAIENREQCRIHAKGLGAAFKEMADRWAASQAN
jgi:hypothetical protein